MSLFETSSDVLRCLKDVWTEQVSFNFTVKIEDRSIKCHQLILAACSDFFQALFRSGMREVTENCVVLQDISMSVFELILQALYTGEIFLDLDNCFEIWQAAHQLQIQFMVKMCEDFVIKSLSVESLEIIYANAQFLDSKPVLAHLKKFMLNNFNQICLTPAFLKLSFCDVQYLIQSQELVVSSEDLVLDAVIRWVEYMPKLCQCDESDDFFIDSRNLPVSLKVDTVLDNNVNNNAVYIKSPKRNNNQSFRKLYTIWEVDSYQIKNLSREDKFLDLLNLVRTCLVNPDVLRRVYNLQIISGNSLAKDILRKALSYQTAEPRHGQWPSAAIHRSCDEYLNCGVIARSGGVLTLLDAADEKVYQILKCDQLKRDIFLLNFDGQLYATGRQVKGYSNRPCRMFVFTDNTWLEVMETPGRDLLLVSHGYFIYILDKTNKVIYSFNPKSTNRKVEKFTNFPVNVDIKHASVFKNFILIFCTLSKNINETSVYMLDIPTKVWTRVDNLNGPAKNVITFSNDKTCFILLSNGSLYEITLASSQRIQFKFITNMWSVDQQILGALTYMEKLIILRHDTDYFEPDETVLRKIQPYFKQVTCWYVDDSCSNFIPIVISKNCLR